MSSFDKFFLNQDNFVLKVSWFKIIPDFCLGILCNEFCIIFEPLKFLAIPKLVYNDLIFEDQYNWPFIFEFFFETFDNCSIQRLFFHTNCSFVNYFT